MSNIRFCSNDGYFEGEKCDECSSVGMHIIDGDKREQVSSFLSGLLRHFPSEYDLHVAENGFADYTEVLDITENKYNISSTQLLAIVRMDEKGRYEVKGDSIRAVYGHSLDWVSIEENGNDDVPNTLYHGTAPRHQEAIQAEGIQPQGRNQVHLSKQRQDAVEVGHRHSNSERVIVFEVDAEQLVEDGYDVSTTNEEVFTVDEVPPSYFTEWNEATMQDIAQIRE